MKRKKKPRSQPETGHKGKKPTTVLLISYCPLLDYRKAGHKPGQTIDLTKDKLKNDLTRILDGLDIVEAHATACLWCRWPDHKTRTAEASEYKNWPDLDNPPHSIPGDTFFPVLIMERGKEITAHLQDWTEGQPGDWFDLLIDDTFDHPTSGTSEGSVPPNRYAVVLMPRATKSIERWKTGYLMTHAQFAPEDWEFEIMFRPLAFGAAISTTYGHIRTTLPGVGERLPLGILDKGLFMRHASDPSTLPGAAIEILGSFQRGDPSHYRTWLDPFLRDLKCPMPGSGIPVSWVNPHFSDKETGK
jgi:hypothetical protein